jgi:hypothetical protein
MIAPPTLLLLLLRALPEKRRWKYAFFSIYLFHASIHRMQRKTTVGGVGQRKHKPTPIINALI